jgi:hypothetical protein
MRTENRRPDTTKLMVAFPDFANAPKHSTLLEQRLSVRLSACSNPKTNKGNKLHSVLNKRFVEICQHHPVWSKSGHIIGYFAILITFKVQPVKYLLQRKRIWTEFPEMNSLRTLRAIRTFLYPKVSEII